jgi:oligopeptide/dipeptide ABC transporter ATP-binding protein
MIIRRLFQLVFSLIEICPFHTRCPIATDLCKQVKPEWQEAEADHFVACHYVGKELN